MVLHKHFTTNVYGLLHRISREFGLCNLSETPAVISLRFARMQTESSLDTDRYGRILVSLFFVVSGFFDLPVFFYHLILNMERANISISLLARNLLESKPSPAHRYTTMRGHRDRCPEYGVRFARRTLRRQSDDDDVDLYTVVVYSLTQAEQLFKLGSPVVPFLILLDE